MRKFIPTLLLGLLPVSVSGLQGQQTSSAPAQKPSERQSSTTLKVDVNLVNVFVTVTDTKGSPVGGLTKDNFILEEDGQQQKISVFDKESAVPLSIALAIDTSLSTRDVLGDIKDAALSFIKRLRPQDRAMVISFDEQAIDHVRDLDATLPTGLLLVPYDQVERGLSWAVEHRHQAVYPWDGDLGLDPMPLIAQAAAYGLRLGCYVVNEPQRMQQLALSGGRGRRVGQVKAARGVLRIRPPL